jgi:hypothetical protein
MRYLVVLLGLLALTIAQPSSGAATNAQWNGTAGDYHVHLITVANGFEVHVHDLATHSLVDLQRGTVTATLLKDGKRTKVPLAHKQKSIMTSALPLTGKWTMLIAINLQGKKPAQARFSSVTADAKPAAAAAAPPPPAKPKTDQHDHSKH